MRPPRRDVRARTDPRVNGQAGSRSPLRRVGRGSTGPTCRGSIWGRMPAGRDRAPKCPAAPPLAPALRRPPVPSPGPRSRVPTSPVQPPGRTGRRPDGPSAQRDGPGRRGRRTIPTGSRGRPCDRPHLPHARPGSCRSPRSSRPLRRTRREARPITRRGRSLGPRRPPVGDGALIRSSNGRHAAGSAPTRRDRRQGGAVGLS